MRFDHQPSDGNHQKSFSETIHDASAALLSCAHDAEEFGRHSVKDIADAAQKKWHDNPAAFMGEVALLGAAGVGICLLAKNPRVLEAGFRLTGRAENYIRPVSRLASLETTVQELSIPAKAIRTESGWIMPIKTSHLNLLPEESVTLEAVRRPMIGRYGLSHYIRTGSETHAMRTPPKQAIPTFTDRP